jgi:hypothetical protein
MSGRLGRLRPAIDRHTAVLDCGHRVHTAKPLPKGETAGCWPCVRRFNPRAKMPVVRVVKDSCAAPCERVERWRR